MNIFFDLDGTLLDSKVRLYRLFQHLVPESQYSFEEYWELKKNKIGHKEIFEKHLLLDSFSVFEKSWLDKIELPEWLSLDKPFEGTTTFLNELKKRHKLYVITARQFESLALSQLDEHGWLGFFEKIFVTGQIKEKFELIKSIENISNEDWLVGDTGKDIQTGKQLGLNTAAVLSGFLSESNLISYNPDIIVANVIDLKFK